MDRSYRELRRLKTFEERYQYLKLDGAVGEATFGSDRYINQRFYFSHQWKNVREHVILRDEGCDLGILGYEIHVALLVHHMNPITPQDIVNGEHWIIDPEFLITTTKRTHNAIHFGDEMLLARGPVERVAGDTKLW